MLYNIDKFRESESEKGFTLIELIVVCALIGTMLVIAVPSLRNSFLSNPIQSDSRKIIGQIQGVRDLAIRSNEAFIIFFDLEQGQIWHQKETEIDDKETEYQPVKFTLDSTVEILDVWTKTDGVNDTGIVELLVTKLGYIDRSILHLQSNNLVKLSLIILPFSPQTEIEEGYFEYK